MTNLVILAVNREVIEDEGRGKVDDKGHETAPEYTSLYFRPVRLEKDLHDLVTKPILSSNLFEKCDEITKPFIIL